MEIKRVKKVIVRRDGKMVHASVDTGYASVFMTECGCRFNTMDENYSEHDYDVRFVLNCKRCRKKLGISNSDNDYINMGIAEEQKMEQLLKEEESERLTVMQGKDVFYEIRLKDGTHEFMYDCMDAQEAAEVMSGNTGIPLTDIECIHKLAVVKVIQPSVNVFFKE